MGNQALNDELSLLIWVGLLFIAWAMGFHKGGQR